MSARDRLHAFVIAETDEDAAEFDRRLDAFAAEVLREAADALDTLPADATSFDQAEHKYKGGATAETLRRLADEAEAGAE